MAQVETTATMRVFGAEECLQADPESELAKPIVEHQGQLAREIKKDALVVLSILRVGQRHQAVHRRRIPARKGHAGQDDPPRCKAVPAVRRGLACFARRCSAWRELPWRRSGVTRWDHAISASLWWWAGHEARLVERYPDNSMPRVLRWKDALWRNTARAVYARGMDLANRLGHGHRRLEKRRWGDAIQTIVSEVTDESWQTVAQDREGRQTSSRGRPGRISKLFPEDATCSWTRARPRERNGRESPESGQLARLHLFPLLKFTPHPAPIWTQRRACLSSDQRTR